MSRGVRDLRQLIIQSRQAYTDDSGEDEQSTNDDSHCQAANALSSQIGQ